MRVAHLTDPHLSSLEGVAFSELRGKRLLGYQSWYRKRRHQYQRHALDRLVAAVHADAPDLIVVTGDLVHIGLESEFLQARAWLEALGPTSQVRMVPGNHDCYQPDSWAAACRAYAGYLAHSPDITPSGSDRLAGFPAVHHHGEVALIAATSAHPAPWWAAVGTLGAEQRRGIAESLAATAGAFRIFALHHPPLPDTCSWRKALTDAKALEEILRQGNPHVVLHGHLHRNTALATPYGRIYCTASAASVRGSTPASYRLFDISRTSARWNVSMTLKCLGADGVAPAKSETFTMD